ncbi:hypothetical protein FQZ97_1063520 [compost metagenome]
MLKRSRKALMSSSPSFLVWWTVFLPSPILPMPKPLTVLTSSTEGWPLWFWAAWKAAYTFCESWPPRCRFQTSSSVRCSTIFSVRGSRPKKFLRT